MYGRCGPERVIIPEKIHSNFYQRERGFQSPSTKGETTNERALQPPAAVTIVSSPAHVCSLIGRDSDIALRHRTHVSGVECIGATTFAGT